MDLLPFSPVTGTEYPDFPVAKCESNGDDVLINGTKTKIPLFQVAVAKVFKNDSLAIQKCLLCQHEADAVLGSV